MQEKLIILRKTNGVSQKEISNYLGITNATYSLKENGKFQFTANEMFMLSSFFKLPIEDIFLPTILQNGVKEQ